MLEPRPTSASPIAGVTALDAMRPGVIGCLPEDRIPTVAAIMVTRGIHAVVLSPFGRGPSPIVTDLGLVRAALEQPDACAADIAQEPAASLAADAPLDAAVAMMSEQLLSHLLVADPNSGAPAGIISSFDVAALLGGHEPRYARTLRPGPARPSPSASTLSKGRVADVMHRGIATCAADASLAIVAQSMAEHRVHCIVVTGVGRRDQTFTWGLVTDMDLVIALNRGALDQPAASIAATSPIAVEESESLERAAALMVEHDTSHVVVTGHAGLPSGMISTLDVASILGAAA